MKILTLRPAYGRRVASMTGLEKMWKDGCDFKIDGGPYTSIRDLETLQAMADSVIVTGSNADDSEVYTFTVWADRMAKIVPTTYIRRAKYEN